MANRDQAGSFQQPQVSPGAASYRRPTYGAPVYGAPTYENSGYGAPTYGDSGYGVPTYGDSGYGAPAYAPAYGAPPQSAFPSGAPSFGASTSGASAYEASASRAPPYMNSPYGSSQEGARSHDEQFSHPDNQPLNPARSFRLDQGNNFDNAIHLGMRQPGCQQRLAPPAVSYSQGIRPQNGVSGLPTESGVDEWERRTMAFPHQSIIHVPVAPQWNGYGSSGLQTLMQYRKLTISRRLTSNEKHYSAPLSGPDSGLTISAFTNHGQASFNPEADSYYAQGEPPALFGAGSVVDNSLGRPMVAPIATSTEESSTKPTSSHPVADDANRKEYPQLVDKSKVSSRSGVKPRRTPHMPVVPHFGNAIRTFANPLSGGTMPFRFKELPAELRNIIYRHLVVLQRPIALVRRQDVAFFKYHETVCLFHDHKRSPRGMTCKDQFDPSNSKTIKAPRSKLERLAVDRATYSEATGIFWSENEFAFTSISHMQGVIDGRPGGVKLIRQAKFKFESPTSLQLSWSDRLVNFESLRKLCLSLEFDDRPDVILNKAKDLETARGMAKLMAALENRLIHLTTKGRDQIKDGGGDLVPVDVNDPRAIGPVLLELWAPDAYKKSIYPRLKEQAKGRLGVLYEPF